MPDNCFNEMYENTFNCIFDTYKNRLFGYVLAISHSRYVAEEITQEIFLKLWLCRDMLDRVDNIEHYIFTIARHKTLNHLRKAAYDVKLLRELQQAMILPANNVDEKAQLADCEKLLREAVTLLSPQRRLVYQLSRSEGLNHKEIAHQLQLSQHTVKNHLVQALQFIRDHLARYHSVTLLLCTILCI
jgi:RNA polymerase sigma-70 factor (ECF subfamily)